MYTIHTPPPPPLGGSSAYPGAELRSVVQRVVAEELRPLQRDLAALRAECQRGEPNQSWAQCLDSTRLPFWI